MNKDSIIYKHGTQVGKFYSNATSDDNVDSESEDDTSEDKKESEDVAIDRVALVRSTYIYREIHCDG
jgi:hypothetical protein